MIGSINSGEVMRENTQSFVAISVNILIELDSNYI